MITSSQCIQHYGLPGGKNEGAYMASWSVPDDIQRAFAHVVFSAIGKKGFPAKIYCNRLITARLEVALRGLMKAGITQDLKTWDGCYMVRKMRGYAQQSLHSWGLAVDVNAADNRLGHDPTLSKAFVQCFILAGFDWGGTWTRKDGMHFQLKSF